MAGTEVLMPYTIRKGKPTISDKQTFVTTIINSLLVNIERFDIGNDMSKSKSLNANKYPDAL